MNNDLKQIYQGLKAPFDQDKIEFKVGATNKEKTQGLALAYVEARAIQDRLDEVIGFGNWKVSYQEIQGGFLCTLSLRINGEWIDKQDGSPHTEYESIKGGISSAFKRVASSGWAIGRYLYEAKANWYPIRARGKSYEFITTPSLSAAPTGNKPPEQPKTSPEDKLTRARLMEVTFGKYKGSNLGTIYDSDKQYFKYLTDNSKDTRLVNACRYLNSHVN